MNTNPSKQAGSLFTALVMVFTMLGLPSSPAHAGAPALAQSALNSLSTPITTITRVSVDSGGAQGNGWSESASISADGRYVAFESDASNLVSGNTNGSRDIFLRDTQTGTTTRLSVDSNGTQGNGRSVYPSISADGRYVVFGSWASNLVSGDTNVREDIFVRDTKTDTTTRLSVDSSGTQGNGFSESQSISADGRYVAFASYTSNLVSGNTNGSRDIFLRDTQTDTTTRLSVDSSWTQANGDSYYPSISADERYVAFSSGADNLVRWDTNSAGDIFLRDTQTGTTTRLSTDSSGWQGNFGSEFPSISADGRYVAFLSLASNLVSGGYEWRRGYLPV
jgi:Tol biopolymer transport system component